MTGCLLSPAFYIPQPGIILPIIFQIVSFVLQEWWRKRLWQTLMTWCKNSGPQVMGRWGIFHCNASSDWNFAQVFWFFESVFWNYFGFSTAVDLAHKNLQNLVIDPDQSPDNRIRAEFQILLDGYRKIVDLSFSKSKDFRDILRFLPGVVVQKELSIQGMAHLYRIKPDFLERLIKSTIEPLRPTSSIFPRYILDDYLSGLLQDRDRSQLYYCNPMLQHISICHQFLSLLDRSNVFHAQS